LGDIGGHARSQHCGFEHLGTWTETQDDKTGMILVFELGMHGIHPSKVSSSIVSALGKHPHDFIV
jgi:hypothetical protein